MSITIKIGDTPISDEIHFTEMSPWHGNAKTITHTPDGANYDIVYHTGRHSKSTSISGYCKRTTANLTELDKLDNGQKITITHSIEGTKNGLVTALQVKPTAGGIWVTFSMTVVEQ